MTPIDISDSLLQLCDEIKAAQEAHLAELRKVADIIRAINITPPKPPNWLAFPFNYFPIRVTTEFGVPMNVGGVQWQHEGIDFALPIGISISACAPGKVIYSGILGGYGNLIRIEHVHNAETWWTWYAHLSEIKAQASTIVLTGQVIGVSGATGNVTGAHLHLNAQRESSDFVPQGCKATLRGVVNPRDWLIWP
jgi:murein DD-endopeptidase MepM/ murein hydrolase activator NlpD